MRKRRPCNEAFINIEKAAKLLDVSVSMLYQRTRRRTIPHVRIGRAVRFDPQELRAWASRPRRSRRHRS